MISPPPLIPRSFHQTAQSSKPALSESYSPRSVDRRGRGGRRRRKWARNGEVEPRHRLAEAGLSGLAAPEEVEQRAHQASQALERGSARGQHAGERRGGEHEGQRGSHRARGAGKGGARVLGLLVRLAALLPSALEVLAGALERSAGARLVVRRLLGGVLGGRAIGLGCR